MKTKRPWILSVAACAALSAGFGGASAGATTDDPSRSSIVVAQVEKTTGRGEGVVRAIDADERKLMITHGPVSGPLEMSPMTMAFRVAPTVDLSTLSKGKKIKFTISRDAKGLYIIEDVQPEKP
ncbi:copper-binding protein [Methylocystis sp. B8]|uniref:copper-binding protein n=1 Tax=Methylocystis sp. B8 TaxID=544938 RepID=UPI0010FE07C0|nr:copper-binding protein [Methylocystis sp. B8]TLG79175.1 copper-binding protein [Methylocystis sp. B8]